MTRTKATTTNLGLLNTKYLKLTGGTLTGNLLFTDNTLDIGASGATRPRTGYFGTSLVVPTIIAPSTSLALKPTTNATTAIQLQNAAGTSILNVDTTNGRVGIGTASPQKLVDIAALRSDLLIHSIQPASNADDVLGSLLFFNAEDSTSGEGSRVAAGMRLTAVDQYGKSRLEFTAGTSSPIVSYGDPEDYTDNSIVRMVILGANGNVGIGTTSPAGLLAVGASSQFTVNSTGDITTSSTGELTIGGTGNSSIAGNLGIGTTAPTYKLEVVRNVDDFTGELILQNLNTGTGARSGFWARNDDGTGIRFGIAGSNYTGETGWANKAFMGTDGAADGFILYTNSAGDDIEFQLGAVGTTDVIFKSDGNVGIGITAPLAKLHIDQSSTTGAKPVLTVDQADVSEEFIKFIGTSTSDASQSLIDAADMTTPGSLVGWLKIYVQDDQATTPITDGVYYVPFYSAPTA